MAVLDSLDLARRLIRCPSVTPQEGGALDLLQEVLEDLGFRCRRLVFSDAGTPDVDNLYARLGETGPNFCFAGHTDVVSPGDPAAWRHDPFAAELAGGWLYGRGAVDMKGAIAAYLGALSRFLEARGPEWKPRGAVAEGDVTAEMHHEEGLLSHFSESWQGSASAGAVAG